MVAHIRIRIIENGLQNRLGLFPVRYFIMNNHLIVYSVSGLGMNCILLFSIGEKF
jgi:hypothetical protein